jgi:hypothetical protein
MVVFLIYVLPLALPSLIYVLWRLWRARPSPGAAPAPEDDRGGASGTPRADGVDAGAAAGETIDWREAPWLWLLLAGAALLVLVLLLGIFNEGAPDQGRYLPPRMEDGRILPGELRPGTDGAAPETGRGGRAP